METNDTLSVQDFCTENPKVGSDELLWGSLFKHQFPELYMSFLEVFAAYETSKDTRLPLSEGMTERTPMFWRDCWESLAVLPSSILSTVEGLLNSEYDPVQPDVFFGDVVTICESHWTLAAALGNIDSSRSCVVPVMLCCSPELLNSVFFYKGSPESVLEAFMNSNLLTEKGVDFLLWDGRTLHKITWSTVMYSIKKGFSTLVDRLIEMASSEILVLKMLENAIKYSQEKVALMIAKSGRLNLADISILRISSNKQLLGMVSFLLREEGDWFLRDVTGYISIVAHAALNERLDIFRCLMEYPEPEFWVSHSAQLRLLGIHRYVLCAHEGVRTQMLEVLLLNGFEPITIHNIIPLWIDKGDMGSVRLLLEDGRANLSDNYHSSVYAAVNIGSIEMARAMVEDGRESLMKFLGESNSPFLCAANAGNVDIFSLLLSHLRKEERGDPRILKCALKSHNMAIFQTLLDSLSDSPLDIGTFTNSDILQDLVRKGKVDILRLIFSCCVPLSYITLSQLLLMASSIKPLDCFHLILDTGGRHLDCSHVLHEALKANNPEIVRLLLEDDRADPTRDGSLWVIRTARAGHNECLEVLLGDERVKKALPLTDKTLLLLCDEKVNKELMDEYLTQAIDNLIGGRMILDVGLSRLQMKELARRTGHFVHSGMNIEELTHLVFEKPLQGDQR